MQRHLVYHSEWRMANVVEIQFDETVLKKCIVTMNFYRYRLRSHPHSRNYFRTNSMFI